MPTVVFYISGHGFGHASRDIEVINALGESFPSTCIIVRTAAPRWLFDLTVKVPHTLHRVETDTGVVQHDSLSHDITETVMRAAAFYREFDRRVRGEAEFLRSVDASLVVGDIPPLAFAAAAAARVPACALGNFTWDWIYEEYAQMRDQAAGAMSCIRAAYAQAEQAWRLPLHGGFDAFARIVDVPFIARHARHDPGDTRQALGLPMNRRLVLSSFGGYGLGTLPLDDVDCLDDYDVVIAEASLGAARRPAGRGVYALVESGIYAAGFRYEDLVRAADVVLTKPGFGIVAECLANQTAVVYTSRGAFREYDVLVREMPSLLRCGFISHDDLFSGRWRRALDAALSAPEPTERPRTDGARIVAELIGERLR